MINVDISFRIKELTDEIKKLAEEVSEVKKSTGVNELWDNSDMIRNWKISPRTLASWRSEGCIEYVQVGGKIWYPKEAREMFIKKNYVITKNEEDFDDERN